MVIHQPLDDSLAGRIQTGLLTARRWLWGNIAGGPVLAQHFLNKGATHPKHRGHSALRAEVLLTSPPDLLTEIDGIGSHRLHARRDFSYEQVKTALGRPCRSVGVPSTVIWLQWRKRERFTDRALRLSLRLVT